MNVDRGRPDQPRNFAVAAVLLVHLLLAPTRTYGQALKEVAFAPDVTVTLGGTGVGAGVLAADDLSGGVTVLAIPDLPAAASISAVHRFPNGDLLLAFDSTLALPGGAGIVEPRDLVRFTSATEAYSIPVRGADVGIPNGARIDAVAVTGAETILLSLDVSVGMFDDEDVLRVDGNSLVLFLDLSEFGIAQSLDLDGLDVEESGSTRLYLSFDGSSTVDAVAFDDEDIVVFDLTTHVWALAYDGSAAAAQWPAAADLIALDVVLEATATATPTSTSPLVTSTATATATVTPTQPVADTATATSTASAATGTATATATLPAATSTETVTFTPVAGTATATATEPNATATVTATATQSPTGPVPSTATATATATVAIPCPGDCDGSGDVTIDELVRLVNIALDSQPLSLCPAGDLDNSGSIAINEIVAAVNSALFGCP